MRKVHLACTPVNSPDHYDPALLNLFCDEEAQRISSIGNDQVRLRSIAVRALFIQLLDHLGISQSVCKSIIQNETGRLVFASGTSDSFYFNFSHSHDYVTCAIWQEAQIGLDIEKISVRDFQRFRRVLSDQEMEMLKSHPDGERDFIRLWTCKESLVKADGSGIRSPLRDIHIGDQTKVQFQSSDWQLITFDQLAPGYFCTVCVQGDFRPEVEVHTFG